MEGLISVLSVFLILIHTSSLSFLFVFIRAGLAIRGGVLAISAGGVDTTALQGVDKLWITLLVQATAVQGLRVGLLETRRELRQLVWSVNTECPAWRKRPGTDEARTKSWRGAVGLVL